MARKGRELEEFVSFLEKNLGPQGIKVTSPDFFQGKISHSRREVDVTLRSRIGSSEILVLIECRDHQKAQDVTWIEQLDSKRKDVGGDLAIAVSSSDFTPGAGKLAETFNIKLRTIKNIDICELMDWLQIKELTFHHYYSEILSIFFELVGHDEIDVIIPDDVKSQLERGNLNAKIFRTKNEEKLLSFNDIWRNIPQDIIFAKILPGGDKFKCPYKINFSDVNNSYQLLTEPVYLDIKSIEGEVILWIEEQKKPIKSSSQYSDESRALVQSIEFEEIGYDGEKLELTLHAFKNKRRLLLSWKRVQGE